MKDKRYIIQMVGFALLCLALIAFFVACAVWGFAGGLVWVVVAIIVVAIPCGVIAALTDSDTPGRV